MGCRVVSLNRTVAVATVLASFLLAGCFLSTRLFEQDRIWDPAWFGRYEGDGIMFVVLPDDPAKRTYLVGSFEVGATKIDSYRVALYPGWQDTAIIGSIDIGKSNEPAVYSILRTLGPNRFSSLWPDCSADFAKAHNLPRQSETCSFTSLDTLRRALRAFADEEAARPRTEGNLQPQGLERRRDHPLSSIGVVARAGVITTSEGVHGALTLLEVPPGSPAAQAGLKRGDVVFGVGNPRPAIGEELLLRIAVEPPGTVLQLSYFDGQSKEKRQTVVTTAAAN